MLYTATISSQSSLSFSEDDDDDVAAVSSLEPRFGAGARSAALREINVYKASDDDRWVARGHWTLAPSASPADYGGNLSHGGLYDNWMSADQASKSKKDDADLLFHDFHEHEKRRILGGHQKTRRHGNRRWTTAARRRTGRHVKRKQSFNDVRDYELDELEMPSSCADLHCTRSARCVMDERYGHARCRCPVGTTGIYCEQGQYFSACVELPR